MVKAEEKVRRVVIKRRIRKRPRKKSQTKRRSRFNRFFSVWFSRPFRSFSGVLLALDHLPNSEATSSAEVLLFPLLCGQVGAVSAAVYCPLPPEADLVCPLLLASWGDNKIIIPRAPSEKRTPWAAAGEDFEVLILLK